MKRFGDVSEDEALGMIMWALRIISVSIGFQNSLYYLMKLSGNHFTTFTMNWLWLWILKDHFRTTVYYLISPRNSIFIVILFYSAMSETTVAFLEKLSNRTTKGTSEEIQKRVTHSSSIIERLVVRMEKNMKRNKELIETLKNEKV